MIRNTIDLSMIAIRSSMICTAHLYRAQTIMTPVAHTQPMTIGQTIHAAPAGPVISPTTRASARTRWRNCGGILIGCSNLTHTTISNNMDLAPNRSSSSTICSAHLYRAQTIMDRAKMIMKAVAQPMTSGRTTHAAPAAHPRLPTRSASATTGCRDCGGISIRCYNRQKGRNSIHGECSWKFKRLVVPLCV